MCVCMNANIYLVIRGESNSTQKSKNEILKFLFLTKFSMQFPAFTSILITCMNQYKQKSSKHIFSLIVHGVIFSNTTCNASGKYPHSP